MNGGLEPQPRKPIGGRHETGGEVLAGLIEKEKAELADADTKSRANRPEICATVTEWIKDIDVGELFAVCQEYLEKSGVPIDRFNTPEEIYFIEGPTPGIFVKNDGFRMFYSVETNSIGVNINYYRRLLDKHPDTRVVRANFLDAYTDELVHAVGYNSISAESTGRFFKKTSRTSQRTGIWDRSETITTMPLMCPDINETELFGALYEGIAAKISHEIVLEYCRRKPAMVQPAIMEEHIIGKRGDRSGYVGINKLVDQLVFSIARKDEEVDTEIVWRGFVRQYFSGELDPEEIRSLIAETMGEHFASDLAGAKTERDVERIMSTHEDRLPDQYAATEKWLEHLKTARGAK